MENTNSNMDFTIEDLMEIKRAINTLIEDRTVYSFGNIPEMEKNLIHKQIENDYKILNKVLQQINRFNE